MNTLLEQPTHKKITIKVTIQRLWECEALADYREQCSTDHEHMQRLTQKKAQGEPIWVDCHDVTVAWVREGLIQIGRQQYAVGPLDDGYHLRCICVGCPMDMAYCQVNHTIRLSDHFYASLRQKAKVALLPDGAVIRFASPFDLGPAGKHDTFRKGPYTYGEKRGGRTVKKTSTTFFTLDTNQAVHIVNWHLHDWEVVSLPEDTKPLKSQSALES